MTWVPGVLTTAALSNHSHGNPQLNLTNLSGTTASNSAGFTLSLSAAAGLTNINLSAGATSQNLSNFVFSNSNGVSFGLNGSTVTASHDGLTTAMASNRGSDFVQANAAFAGTNASGTIASNGISVSVGPYITTAMLSNAVTLSNVRVSAGTTSNLLSAITFADSNGVSWGLNAGTLTATVKTDYLTTAALSNHSHGNPQLNLTNLSGTTASNSAGFTLSLSAAAPGAGGGIAAAAGTQTGTSGTVLWENSNGITFGMSGSTRVTASHNGLTTARASNDAVGLATALTAGPLAWTVNSAGISLNADSAAGTSSGFAGANISGSITHNTAGINLSLSVAAPGGGADKSASWHVINEGGWSTAGIWNNATYSNRPFFVPFKMGEALTAVNSIAMYVSRTGGTSVLATLHAGFYTIANATSMNLLSSTSFAISLTTSAQFSGIRRIQWTGLGALSLSPGQYVLGLLASVAGTASWGMNMIGTGTVELAGILHPGTNSTAATASGTRLMPFQGVWNATSAALPAAVGTASISGGALVNSPSPIVIVKAIE